MVDYPSTCPVTKDDSALDALIAQKQSEAIAELMERVKELPPVELPVTHHFAPGIYVRHITMPKGAVVVGCRHVNPTVNIVLCGKAIVSMNGKTEIIEGPCIFNSEEGDRKVLLILEDMRFATVHKTDTTDPEELVRELTNPEDAEANLQYYADIEALKLAAKTA